MDGATAAVTVLAAADAVERQRASDLASGADPGSEFGATVKRVFERVASGEQLVVIGAVDEVTPARAAELLGVSRQFVDRLLADGVLPFRHLPGSRHRRIAVSDVVGLRSERDRRREGAAVIRAVLSESP